ncbi:MAG: hypothetical protein M1828_001552 [Chrysothrix sp. TS-e1954]|nr:MAG: hypothetical protein M1828_001552 [Chrysothrix sp. TS-e1954]
MYLADHFLISTDKVKQHFDKNPIHSVFREILQFAYGITKGYVADGGAMKDYVPRAAQTPDRSRSARGDVYRPPSPRARSNS